ncbi:MAG: hypothetical protein NT001_02090 [Candidatus Woesearchaeota archaeon]|nr:hypothetical protein [Candidatus Woesearchaeota archaeon]
MEISNKIFDELKNRCGLSEKQTLVMKCLRNGDLTAKKLSSKANIPLGRLYEYISELLGYGLIEKRGKKPCIYSMDNADEKIRNFLKTRFNRVINDEKDILNMLNKKDEKDYIEITKTKEEFIYTQLKMLGTSKKFYTYTRFGSIPFIIYPSKLNKFMKLREAIMKSRSTLAGASNDTSMMINKAYIDAYASDRSLIAIICKESFDFHINLVKKELGQEFYEDMIDDLKDRIRDHDIKIYLVDKQFPLQIFLNEDVVYVSIVQGGATYGTIMHSKDARDIYMHLFEEMTKRAIPIEKYLKGPKN